MKNFKKIDIEWLSSIFPTLQQELADNSMLWEIDRRRQSENRPLMNTHCIPLRNNAQDVFLPYTTADDIMETIDTPFANAFPAVMQFLLRFAGEMNGALARAYFTSTNAYYVVGGHTHMGNYYADKNRYHLVIDSLPGTVMRSGNEEVRMNTGEVWWFNDKERHFSDNQGSQRVVHLAFDLLPDNPSPLT